VDPTELTRGRTDQATEPTCDQCGEPYWDRPHKLGKRRYCSRWCNGLRLRDPETFANPWNELQRASLRYMAARKIGLTTFAREVGVSRLGLRYWFRRKDSTPRWRTLKGVAKVLGISMWRAARWAATYPDGTRKKGPVTDEKRRAQLAREKLAPANPFFQRGTKENLKAVKGSHTKRREKNKHKKRGQKEPGRKGADANTIEKAVERARSSVKARLAHRLFGRLRWRRTPPSLTEVREWANAASRDIGLSPRAVFIEWEPHLVRLQIIRAARGGRKPKDRSGRRRLMERLLANQEPGRRRNRFWPEAAAEVSELEGEPITYKNLRRWCYAEGLIRTGSAVLQ
jgi:hypothetical protein